MNAYTLYIQYTVQSCAKLGSKCQKALQGLRPTLGLWQNVPSASGGLDYSKPVACYMKNIYASINRLWISKVTTGGHDSQTPVVALDVQSVS